MMIAMLRKTRAVMSSVSTVEPPAVGALAAGA